MSGSLLLILAVWLLLMAPLLLRKQSPVRRTSRGMSETRILHEGGAKRSRRPSRLPPAEGHYMSSDEDVDADIDFVEAEPEYVLFDEDGDARDEKIIAVCLGDPIYAGYRDIHELPSHLFEEIRHFFSVYKQLEFGKATLVEGFLGREEAIQTISRAKERYHQKFE